MIICWMLACERQRKAKEHRGPSLESQSSADCGKSIPWRTAWTCCTASHTAAEEAQAGRTGLAARSLRGALERVLVLLERVREAGAARRRALRGLLALAAGLALCRVRVAALRACTRQHATSAPRPICDWRLRAAPTFAGGRGTRAQCTFTGRLSLRGAQHRWALRVGGGGGGWPDRGGGSGAGRSRSTACRTGRCR